MSRKSSILIAAGALLSGIAVAQASPFPMSVNETASFQPEPYAAPATDPAQVVSIRTVAAFPVSVSEVGQNSADALASAAPAAVTAQAETAQRTIVVRPTDQYLNVAHLERVRIVDDKGRSFLWTFDTLGEDHFPLKSIAPAGFDAGPTVIYVTHPESHRITG